MSKICLIIIFVVFCLSCVDDSRHPGYTFYPEMIEERAYTSHSVANALPNKSLEFASVEGTVPMNADPYWYAKNDVDRKLAGQELNIPLKITPEVLLQGKKLYNDFCMMCHGQQGDGKGHLVTSGLYLYNPSSLLTQKVQEAPIGEVYHVITVGFNIMGAHGSQIKSEDRWKISAYILSLKNTFE